MNGKELVELLNTHNTQTWPYYAQSLTLDQLFGLRKEMQQGLSRICPDRGVILTGSGENQDKIMHKTYNFIGYLDKLIRFKLLHKYMKRGIDKEQADRLIEEALLQNAY